MKTLLTTAVLAVLIAAGTTTKAQDWPEEYLGLPGDNLNLYAVMNLFQQSETLEEFERNLNDENSGINNLDLNGDHLVDYIMVTDFVDGNVHNIILRVALSKKQKQDVAVFTVERFQNGSVQIQLVGDEALYGRNYIIEPHYDEAYGETPNPGFTGKPVTKVNVTVVATSPREIAGWPVVRFIFLPDYECWHSHWDWGYWPVYWTAWHPWYWHYYYGYHYSWQPYYYAHFRPWNDFRYHRYHDFYFAGVRSWSKDVHKHISKGHYQTTYSRPELRKEGEALYTRAGAGKSIGSREMGATRSRLNAEVPETARVRSTRSSGSVAVREPGMAVPTRSSSDAGADRVTNATRRSGATVVTKSAATVPASSGAQGRPAGASVNNRSESTTHGGQPATTVRRSSGTGSSQPAQQPAINTKRNSGSSSSSVSTASRPAPQPVQRTTPAVSTSRQYGNAGSAAQVYSGGGTTRDSRSGSGTASASTSGASRR